MDLCVCVVVNCNVQTVFTYLINQPLTQIWTRSSVRFLFFFSLSVVD